MAGHKACAIFLAAATDQGPRGRAGGGPSAVPHAGSGVTCSPSSDTQRNGRGGAQGAADARSLLLSPWLESKLAGMEGGGPEGSAQPRLVMSDGVALLSVPWLAESAGWRLLPQLLFPGLMFHPLGPRPPRNAAPLQEGGPWSATRALCV